MGRGFEGDVRDFIYLGENMAKDKKVNLEQEVREALATFKEVSRKFKSGRHDDSNQEMIDPRPMSAAIKYRRPPTLQEQMEAFVRSAELRRFAEASGVETFDEANDFEVDDFDDPLERFFNTPTPWEETRIGQFEEDAEAIRKKVDEMVNSARERKAKYENEQRELSELRKKVNKKPKGGTPPAGEDDEDFES